ncbi:MFS transporter [Hamadaea tsunoensis]|uniref:MFS transporter n=1 Tax=Hamadaea tsunoensis TaxID=53368 RepID=UPI00040CD2D0|nr:MFS transporter [Hamadaea tsunoensis]
MATIFAVHGAVSGSVAARMPWIAEHVGVGGSVGRLGFALVMPAIGGILTMPFAGRIVHALGGRRATALLIGGWAASLVLISLAPNLVTLAAVMFLSGVFACTSDMAMNAEGIAVERELGRSVMSSLHGMWSVGGFAAGGLGWLMAHWAVDARAHYLGVAAVLIAVGVWASYQLPVREPEADEEGEKAPSFAFPRGLVLVIGLVGFASICAEAASADWSAVYLVRQMGAPDAVGAIAYASFAGAMTLSRLTGDLVVRRWGPVGTVRVAGAVGVVGAVLVSVSGALGGNDAPTAARVTAIAGFALVGLGIAVVVPLAFAAAGHSAETPAGRAHAIAAVATVAYGAGLAAPGIVGGVASFTSLSVSFALVAVLVLVTALCAPVLKAGNAADLRAQEELAAAGVTGVDRV